MKAICKEIYQNSRFINNLESIRLIYNSFNEFSFIRWQVASNPKTPVSTLIKLSKDKDSPSVRYSAKQNQTYILYRKSRKSWFSILYYSIKQKLSLIKNKLYSIIS